MLEAGQIMEELVEKIFEMMTKYSVGFVVEQCRTTEHACIMTEMGPKGLLGVQGQWAGGQVEIPRLLPSQNVGVHVLNTAVWGSEGVRQ
jgi:hypothetical protein